jgi:hypothetical protein
MCMDMFVCCVGSGLCDELITGSGDSCCVRVGVCECVWCGACVCVVVCGGEFVFESVLCVCGVSLCLRVCGVRECVVCVCGSVCVRSRILYNYAAWAQLDCRAKEKGRKIYRIQLIIHLTCV